MTRLHRSNDPDTSRIAGESSASFSADHRRKILEALRFSPGTKDELAERTGLSDVQVCRRLSELEDDRLVETTGVTRASASGRPARVWRLKPAWARGPAAAPRADAAPGGLFE